MNLYDYKHIIWDWNGTLFNDVYLCSDIMNHLLEKRSLPVLTIDKYRDIFTFPVKDYYIKAGHDFTDESFEKIGKEFMDEYEVRKYECNLYPFTLKVLEKFKSNNINQYLLSAYKQESLLHIIKKYGIAEYFSEVYGLDHIYADGKLELGRKLMRRIRTNGKDEKVLLIGDTVHDFRSEEHTSELQSH